MQPTNETLSTLIHPRKLDLGDDACVQQALKTWQAIDFTDPAEIERLNRFYKGDIFNGALLETFPLPIDAIAQGSFVHFLKTVASIPRREERLRVMLAFMDLKGRIDAGILLSKADLEFCHQYGLCNLAGAKIDSITLDHNLVIDLGQDGFLQNVRVNRGAHVLRAGWLESLSAESLCIENVKGDALYLYANRWAYINDASADVRVTSEGLVTLQMISGKATVVRAYKVDADNVEHLDVQCARKVRQNNVRRYSYSGPSVMARMAATLKKITSALC